MIHEIIQEFEDVGRKKDAKKDDERGGRGDERDEKIKDFKELGIEEKVGVGESRRLVL